jgi:hypothetical protein
MAVSFFFINQCPMGLCQPLDGITNLEYNLCFLTPNKIIFKEKGASF